MDKKISSQRPWNGIFCRRWPTKSYDSWLRWRVSTVWTSRVSSPPSSTSNTSPPWITPAVDATTYHPGWNGSSPSSTAPYPRTCRWTRSSGPYPRAISVALATRIWTHSVSFSRPWYRRRVCSGRPPRRKCCPPRPSFTMSSICAIYRVFGRVFWRLITSKSRLPKNWRHCGSMNAPESSPIGVYDFYRFIPIFWKFSDFFFNFFTKLIFNYSLVCAEFIILYCVIAIKYEGHSEIIDTRLGVLDTGWTRKISWRNKEDRLKY